VSGRAAPSFRHARRAAAGAGVAALAALATRVSPAGAQLIPPSERVRDCTTSGCHSKTLEHTVLHGPTAVGACEMCHNYADPAKHTFVVKREGRELCDFCHIDRFDLALPVVHDPIAKGECLKCHEPHGGPDHRLLRWPTLAANCAQCHPDTLKGSHVHEPAAKDRCSDCHGPHTAEHAGLLTLPRDQLCRSCHEPVGDLAARAAHPHPPAQGDCLECHASHASDHAAHIRSDPRTLCSSCHKAQEQVALAAAFKHPVVLDGRACLNCHVPHGSERKGLMPAEPFGPCLACHASPIRTPDGKVKVGAVGELTEPGHLVHGPIREGRCTGCHEPHGAPHADLLTAPYSTSFYQKFKPDAYALCFTCHGSKMVMEERTEGLTGFRDGTRNLHYVHVNKEPNGRSCRACHAPHAGAGPSLVLDSVQFGQWRMPMNFLKTDTGGSCAPGCHKPASYSRPVVPGGLGLESAPPG
jgi:predicted CXXCH cytochrome family protein